MLITNCSIYCPTPSLCSMLVNHFKLRRDVQTYHLGGMGCGNGVMAMSLARDLLQARPDSRVLFVPAEITTYCFYPGLQRDFMVANAIFRMGGAAVLLSNRPEHYSSAKYELLHNARAHTGQDDDAYRCMGWGPDRDGVNGVWLRKDVPLQAARALEHCLREVAPRVVTWGQCAEAAASAFRRTVLGSAEPPYSPDFSRCVDHFALHAGGYAVLKGLQTAMRLPVASVLPSFAALRDYGNTSCSTTWYVLAYLETCADVRRGQTVMQIGMGGGMKAGVNVWRANRDLKGCVHPAWAHVAGRPVTEADLPRPISEDKAEAEAAAAVTAAVTVPAVAADGLKDKEAQQQQQQHQHVVGVGGLGSVAAAPAAVSAR